MNTSYIVGLLIVVFINGILVGLMWDDLRRESKGVISLIVTIYSIFGFLILFLGILWEYIVDLWTWIGEATQYKFWYNWYCTDKYKDMSDEKLDTLNYNFKMWAGQRKRDKIKMGITGRSFMYCVGMIRKKYPRDIFSWIDNKENFIY